ncbi:MAG: hypothetical protein GX556_07265 [Fibrobacter sp.]|nr:hypothetical protein [Fibrobacter sp.]
MHKSIFFALLFVTAVSGRYAPNLLINPDLDNLIYRLSSRYGMAVPEDLFNQPYTADKVLDYLGETAEKHGTELSDYEKYQSVSAVKRLDPVCGFLKWYREEKQSGKPDIHLKLQLRLLADIKPVLSSNSSIGVKGIINPLLTGNLGNLSFYSGIDVWTQYRSDIMFPRHNYQPYDGIPYNLFGRSTDSSHTLSSDMLRGGIRYDAGRIRLETAIDYLRTGPALYYPLTLSGSAPPVTYARGMIDLDLVQYSHTAGLLKFQKDKLKFLYAHRLSANLWKSRLNIGFNEVIINGSSTSEPASDSNRVHPDNSGQQRGWEWVYLIPFVPFKFAEHYAGDRDNAALSLDFNLQWPVDFRWYAEIFLDDMLSPQKLFSTDWGNKWALTAGMQFFGTLFMRDMEIDLEYSHVEPWVYTHFYGGSHRYSHFDNCLGSPLGPNSQAIVLSMHSQISKLNKLGIGLNSIAQNRSVRGGNISDVYQFWDPADEMKFHDDTTKMFLGPGTEWSLKPVFYWSFNPFGRFRVDASYKVELLDNKHSSELSLWGGVVF